MSNDEFSPPLPALDDEPISRLELAQEMMRGRFRKEEKYSLARRLYVTLRDVWGETSFLLGPAVLHAIRQRTAKSPGHWYTDITGTPHPAISYGEALINTIVHNTGLTLRRAKGLDEWAEWTKIANVLDKALEDAYQAHRDVKTLLRAVSRLTALHQHVGRLIATRDLFTPDWRKQPMNDEEKRAWQLVLDSLVRIDPETVDTPAKRR